MIYTGLLIVSIVAIYLSYLGLKDARKGKGLGIIEAILGVFLIFISIILMMFSILFIQKYSGEVDIFNICIGIDIILVVLLIIGGFKLFSYFTRIEYIKKMKTEFGKGFEPPLY